MKKRIALVASIFLIAVTFAFTTKHNAKNLVWVQNVGSCQQVTNPCSGNNQTCTISGLTYFATQQSSTTCITALRMQ